VIKGVATNHGGLAAGLTVPNPAKQAGLVRRALRSAEVAADTITYVEAHGTGTALGDPIEMRGLKEAFGPGRTTPACAIGSVKTNIGHLEAAAGLAGLLKVVLALQAKTIPASLNFETLNPHLSFEGSPFRVATEAAPWPRPVGAPRRAGVSSFGSGGSNAHVILEEAPETAKGAVPLDTTRTISAATASARSRNVTPPGFRSASCRSSARRANTRSSSRSRRRGTISRCTSNTILICSIGRRRNGLSATCWR
jgi:polyketide synthase PksN